ncbi:hypothetical protein P7C70_g9512, partial [Phenoliferia sp. Uapishka_3]
LAATDPQTSHPTIHILRTPAGQAFLCEVPVSIENPTPPPTQEDIANRAAERERGLERGLALLDNMKGSCLYQKQGYFTYSFCYGQEIRQFHEVRISGSPGPSEDPNADSYTLGQSPAPVPSSSTPKHGSGSGLVTKSGGGERIPARLGGGMTDGGFGWDEGGRIALIRETAICTYVLLVHTPRLCSEPIFLEGTTASQDPPSIIQCQPIVKKIRESVDAPESFDPATPLPTSLSSSPQLEPETIDDSQSPESQITHNSAEEYQPTSPPNSNPNEGRGEDGRLEGEGLVESVTLIYDPETGVIHSAEMENGEEMFYEALEGDG